MDSVRPGNGPAMINLRNLGVTLGAPLFSNLNLTIVAGDRLGIVAANGRGKSTLLRCMAGSFEPTEGEITRARGLRIGHVEQDVPVRLERHDLPRRGSCGAAGRPGRGRKLARRCRARFCWRFPKRCASVSLSKLERRLAAAGDAGSRLGDRTGHADSRRADQSSRSCSHQPARDVAERAPARCPGGHLQP